MLQLVLGGSGSGKTTLLYQKMKERAHAGQKSILLVPEQFTASTESRIYHELGDAYSGMVQSFSFTTLAEQLLRSCGGTAIQTLSDAGRVVLVRRAMQELQDSLTYYRKQRKNAAFCQMVAQTVSELKSAGITAPQLAHLAQGCGSGRDKLADLALLFASYEAMVQTTGLDPSDRVTLAAARLAAACSAEELPDFLANRAIFIDEFDTFNAPKKQLLGALFCAVDSMTVALCADHLQVPHATAQTAGSACVGQGGDPAALDDADLAAGAKPSFLEDVSLFSGARRVAFDLRALARKAGVGVAAPILLQSDLRHANTPALAALNALLAGQGVPDDAPSPADPAFSVFAAKSREEEARIAVAQMQQLIRGGAVYGKMAIVCRDPALYRTVVRRECRLAGVPLFCDETTTPSFGAPVTALRALLSILCSFDYTDQMVALAKTGLCATPALDADGKRVMVAIPERQILALENYVYTWSPTRAAWQEPFTRSATGFGAQQVPEHEPDAELARKALLPPIAQLCQSARGANISASALTKQLYQCLQALGMPEQQALQVAAVRKVSGIPASEAAAREWNVMMELLDQMVSLLGEEEVTPSEYADLFLLLLNATDLGHIPQNVDAVIFTSAGKMRLNAPDYVFVLGLAEGEFPAPPTAQGLLTDADRDALMAQEIELPDCFENKMVREDVCFYKALTASAKMLWVSWPEGLGLPCSSALGAATAHLQAHCVTAEEFATVASTPAVAIDQLGDLWGENSVHAASLYAALQQENAKQNGAYDAALGGFARLAADPPKQLQQTQTLADLLGDTLSLSASKIETYHTCQYAYFLQYILRLRPRQKAELTPNHSGSLMHWVLEQALTPAPTPYDAHKPVPFVELTPEQLKHLGEILVDAYQAENMPDDTIRFGYLMTRLKKSMVALLGYLQAELRQSEFTPAACEAQIGVDGFAAPEYPLAGDKTLRLIGVIDRIDTWQAPDGTTWMRVVDYKTGQKSFSLKEVYDGLDCQMLLYLFAALHHWQGVQDGGKAAKAAGVQYLLADPAPTSQDRTAAKTPLRPGIEGMLAQDDGVLQAIDQAQTGEYLPFAMKHGKVDARAQKAKLADEAKMRRIETHLEQLVTQMGQRVYAGEIAAEPLCPSASKTPCVWCDFRAICGHEDGKHERGLSKVADPFEAPKEDAKEAEKEAGAQALATNGKGE